MRKHTEPQQCAKLKQPGKIIFDKLLSKKVEKFKRNTSSNLYKGNFLI